MIKQDDILQIQKYLNGELDARAMHELERRALDDPFLADALEGYECAKGDQQQNLADLMARLQQRTDNKEKKLIPWRVISIAASIIIVLGIGVWFITGRQPEKQDLVATKTDTVGKPQTAQVVVAGKTTPAETAKPPVSTNAVVVKPTIPRSSSPRGTVPEFADARIGSDKQKQAIATTTDEAPMAANNEPVMKQDSVVAQYKVQVAANEVAVKEMNDKRKADMAAARKSSAPETLLQSRVPGVTVSTPQGSKTLSGLVLGANNNQPLIGAVVKLEGAKFGAVTDANGRFLLSGVPDKPIINIGYLGYNSKQVRAGNKDSLNITLEPNNSSLSEVAVTGYATQKKEDKPVDQPATEAMPRDGWQALDDYMKKNAVLPDGVTGKVKLSFTVSADGKLSDFEITKSLNKAADQKAIDLINNGPQWIGNSDKTPHQVSLTVKFH